MFAAIFSIASDRIMQFRRTSGSEGLASGTGATGSLPQSARSARSVSHCGRLLRDGSAPISAAIPYVRALLPVH
ncbi:MAG: hypothetical protein AAB570_03495, partial [Patescibacteria group bacterium]